MPDKMSILPKEIRDEREKWRQREGLRPPSSSGSNEESGATESPSSTAQASSSVSPGPDPDDPLPTVEQEEDCETKLRAAQAQIHEQNKEICDLQAQADRQRAVAIRSGRLAFVRQVANQALARENEGLRAAALARRRGRGRAGPRQQCMPGPQPAARASRQPRQPRRLPSPMGRRIGRPAKDNVMRPYPR